MTPFGGETLLFLILLAACAVAVWPLAAWADREDTDDTQPDERWPS